MLPSIPLASLYALALVSSASLRAMALENGLALTPQMGWSSWTQFRCDVSEEHVLAAARALVSTGLKNLGYKCECARVSDTETRSSRKLRPSCACSRDRVWS